jgi:hypothetical protein
MPMNTTIDTAALPAALNELIRTPTVNIYQDGERIILIPQARKTQHKYDCPFLGKYKSDKSLIEELHSIRAESEKKTQTGIHSR